MAANMADLLQLMVDRGSSDLHITSGTYPQIRVNGRLTQLNQFEVLTPQDTQRLAYSVLNEGQKQKFEEENELDLSFGIQGLARFRCNVYRQRGAVGCATATAGPTVRTSSCRVEWAASPSCGVHPVNLPRAGRQQG